MNNSKTTKGASFKFLHRRCVFHTIKAFLWFKLCIVPDTNHSIKTVQKQQVSSECSISVQTFQKRVTCRLLRNQWKSPHQNEPKHRLEDWNRKKKPWKTEFDVQFWRPRIEPTTEGKQMVSRENDTVSSKPPLANKLSLGAKATQNTWDSCPRKVTRFAPWTEYYCKKGEQCIYRFAVP